MAPRAPARKPAPRQARKAASKAFQGAGRSKPGRKGSTFAVLACCVLAAVALPLCLVAFAGMAPTITAAIIDRHPRRYLSRTVGVLNLAGMVHPLIALLRAGINVVGAATVLFDPYQWLWMYGAAAFGWLCYLGAPPIARHVVETRAQRLERELQRRAEGLIEEWGEEVTGRRPETEGAAAANPKPATAAATAIANAGAAAAAKAAGSAR